MEVSTRTSYVLRVIDLAIEQLKLSGYGYPLARRVVWRNKPGNESLYTLEGGLACHDTVLAVVSLKSERYGELDSSYPPYGFHGSIRLTVTRGFSKKQRIRGIHKCFGTLEVVMEGNRPEVSTPDPAFEPCPHPRARRIRDRPGQPARCGSCGQPVTREGKK